MKNKRIVKYIGRAAMLALLLVGFSASAQESLDKLLVQVLQNNQQLKASAQQLEASKLQNHTGITPSDPEVEFGYFPGSNDALGTKQTFSVTQNFSFPTTHIYKKRLADNTDLLLDAEFRLLAQSVMAETWTVWCELVYLNQMQRVVRVREKGASSMLQSIEKRQAGGASSQLETNKAKLFLIDIQNQKRLIDGKKLLTIEKLKLLNGGNDIAVNDTSFSLAILEDWAVLKSRIDTVHPIMEQLQITELLAVSKLKVAKSEWLPNLMLGYESEDIMGDKYSGVKAGISIPLWQNKNAVKQSQAQVMFAESNSLNVKTQVYSVYFQRYTKAHVLNTNVTEFRGSLSEMDNVYLLNRSFELGQISAIDYFRELNYFYDITDQLIVLEYEYQLSLAELYEFSLM